MSNQPSNNHPRRRHALRHRRAVGRCAAAGDFVVTGHSAGDMSLCRARTRAIALSWYFLCSSGRSPILVNRPVDDLPAPYPAGEVDRLAGLMQRRSLFPRLVGAMFVVMPRVLGEDPPEVSFTVDQQVVEALAS